MRQHRCGTGVTTTVAGDGGVDAPRADAAAAGAVAVVAAPVVAGAAVAPKGA